MNVVMWEHYILNFFLMWQSLQLFNPITTLIIPNFQFENTVYLTFTLKFNKIFMWCLGN